MTSQTKAQNNKAKLQKALAQRVLARRRLLHFTQMTHPAYSSGWVHDDICRRLERFSQDIADKKSPRLMLLMPPRHGKQISDVTPVLTTNGWTTHGQLAVGDYVFHPSGRPIRVLAVAEPLQQDCTVAFTDGTTVDCHEHHEWTVYDRSRAEWRTVEAKYIETQTLLSGLKPRARFQLPIGEAAQLPAKQLPIDPYFLGAWLGDGKSSEPVICGTESDLDQICALVPYPRGTRWVHETTGVHYQSFVCGIRALLRTNALLDNKHIPQTYMTASVEQRLRLLAGLVDTDGCVEPDTQRVRFRSGSQELANDVATLVRTLGYRASVDYTPADTRERHITGGESWCVQWTPHDGRGGGLLPRKQVTRVRNRRRIGISKITRTAPQLGRCIQVDSQDGLYMVGETFKVTHNSELASIRFPAWHLGHHPHHEIINVGYNLDLPMKFSRKVREVMREPQYKAIFPDTQLDPDSQSVEAWLTTSGGGFTAAGVGGGITGKGATCLIIDDPIKNQEEADSILTRDKLWDWYQSTAYTRLAPGGGVLCIECMAGDTPVLMSDGTEKRLDGVLPGDMVATFRNGCLSTSKVANTRLSGRDYVYEITTKSGRIVRANGRHPFLTGDGVWTRTQYLTTAHTIVTVKDSAVSGLASRAPTPNAQSQPSAVGCVTNTTIEKSGLTGTARPDTPIKSGCVTLLGSTGMESPGSSSMNCTGSRPGSAPYAGGTQDTSTTSQGGEKSCASTTATPLVRFADSSATIATSQSATLSLSPQHELPGTTSDFILDPVISICGVGEELVYDLQIEETENFIASGLVTHNTWWNDDDLAGRLQQAMGKDPEADQFEIIRYPALSEHWEYRDELTNEILRLDAEIDQLQRDAAEGPLTLLRPIDTCLHEERYPTESLKRIRANLQPRIWSALYQQNPVPDEGMYFKKEFFRYQRALPAPNNLRIYTAWDFAIGEKTHNDWTVGATILQDDTDTLYVLDIHRMKGDSFQIIEAMLDVAERWGQFPGTGYLMGAEDGQIWRAMVPMLKKRMAERKQYPPYEVLRPLSDKLARARPLQGRMQQGRIVFPEGASWLPQAEQELLRFPAGAHDDVVDALAWAVHLCIGKEPPRLEEPAPLPSWRDKLTIMGGGGSHMSA